MRDRERRATSPRRNRYRACCDSALRLISRTAAGGLDHGRPRGIATLTSRRRACLLGMLLCMMWCQTVTALSLDTPLRDLRHTAWGPKEGAPDDIGSLAQAADGFLWMSASGGLFRFDGLRFERVELPHDDRLTSNRIANVFAPPSGGLWIGFVFGGAAFLHDGQMTLYGTTEGLPAGSILAFAQDSTGVVWAASTDGLLRLEGSHWRPMGVSENYRDDGFKKLMVDSADTLWVIAQAKVSFLPKGETSFREADVLPRKPGTANSGVAGIAESPSGAVWLFRDQAIQQLRRNANPGRRIATAGKGIISDLDGSLWVARSGGKLQRFTDPDQLVPGSLTYAEDPSDSYSDKDGLSSGISYGVLLPDREGNVWFATLAGLDRFSDRRVARTSLLPAEHESFFPSMTAIAAGDHGSVWVGSVLQTVQTLEAGVARRREEIGPIYASVRTDDGDLWFATPTSVLNFATGERTGLPGGDLSGPYGIQAMERDRSGAFWMSVIRRGVFRLVDGRWVAWGDIPSLPRLTALTISTDAQGRLWFGYPAGGIAVLDGGSLTVFPTESRPRVGAVTAIYGKRGSVWVGGEMGLARFDGAGFHAVVSDSGSLSSITGLVETTGGDLWANSGAGLVRIDATEIARLSRDPLHRVHIEMFDALDGVIGSSARVRPLPTLVEATDGRLWFVTNLGLYSIDPAHIRRDVQPPPVVVKSVAANDQVYAASSGLKLPQNTTSLRIDYAALSLTMPERIRYRYRLDGVDDGWQEARGRAEAYYTNVAPGPHRFRVIAANHDGVWNETGAALDFSIQPTFAQTKWFIALCVLGAVAVAAGVVRFRFRQVAARMRTRFDERMAERERIARELHDTLLQGTQGLVLKVQSAINRVPEDGPVRRILEDAVECADRVMSEGRDRIQDLRIATDARVDLPRSLAAVGEELVKGSSIDFRTVVEGSERVLNPETTREGYRVGREALLNAFQHARATSIEVQIIYGIDDFSLHVRDDGDGIATHADDAARPGHFGIKGMRERAQEIGAELEIWSRHGAGTEVLLRIPATVAYTESQRLFRWLPFWPDRGAIG